MCCTHCRRGFIEGRNAVCRSCTAMICEACTSQGSHDCRAITLVMSARRNVRVLRACESCSCPVAPYACDDPFYRAAVHAPVERVHFLLGPLTKGSDSPKGLPLRSRIFSTATHNITGEACSIIQVVTGTFSACFCSTCARSAHRCCAFCRRTRLLWRRSSHVHDPTTLGEGDKLDSSTVSVATGICRVCFAFLQQMFARNCTSEALQCSTCHQHIRSFSSCITFLGKVFCSTCSPLAPSGRSQ